jgi:hypothetical protein
VGTPETLRMMEPETFNLELSLDLEDRDIDTLDSTPPPSATLSSTELESEKEPEREEPESQKWRFGDRRMPSEAPCTTTTATTAPLARPWPVGRWKSYI